MTTFLKQYKRYGYDFIPAEFLPAGKDEYYLRNEQLEALYANKVIAPNGMVLSPDAGNGKPRLSVYRNLTETEITFLIQNGNICGNWSDVLVKDQFNPRLVKNNFFAGLVRLGEITEGLLRYNDFVLPVGITSSRIISCDIGDRCAVHNCSYLSHYITGDGVILYQIDEMDTTNHCKAGEGVIKDGEDESVRVWICPANEAGGRSVLAFNDMNCADAYLWATNRHDTKLMQTLMHITEAGVDCRRGLYGTVGHHAVIKHCNTIKDVRVGGCAYIKGANKLKNITIKSDAAEPAQIGEGVEMVNGILGFGSHVFYGVKAVRFVIGNNCSLKYGARLIHSVLGDNSTVSCCEVLNNLVFPAHEQHHNNSFLIASMVMGQSNLAAGATVGSNHNSRGNDGEIFAGRGFWPGLSSAIKHNSRFACFTLIAKGNYPVELNISLPFSLVTNNRENSRRVVMPAYWWMYNMYALERNAWKYKARDSRVYINQCYETDYLAPDTVGEIINGIAMLNTYAPNTDEYDRVLVGARTFERSERDVRVVKVKAALRAYRQMLTYYAAGTLCEYLLNNQITFATFQNDNPGEVSFEWENLGGLLIPAFKAALLRDKIKDGALSSWQAIHSEYDNFKKEYPLDKALNALQVVRFLTNKISINKNDWNTLLDEALRCRTFIEEQVFKTKHKDYADTYRNITYSCTQERDAVLGILSENSFIKNAKENTKLFFNMVEQCRIWQ